MEQCKTCMDTRKVEVANGEDDFDVVDCPDCVGVNDEDMTGATGNDR